DGSVDAIVVGQAFHWFDAGAFRAESQRICKEPRWGVLVWNRRLLDATSFLRAYEAFLREWGTDYADVSGRYEDPEAMRRYFGGPYALAEFANRQEFTREDLRERVLSSSYIPAEDDPRRKPMLQALDRLFDTHAEDGKVAFLYATAAYVGRILP